MRVILSYGLGVDSTSLLLNWIENPDSRRYRYQVREGKFAEAGPFDLKDLTVLTAMTGDEFPDLRVLVEKHILPRLRANGIRFVQVARKSATEKLKVLDDTRAPKRLYLDGAYKLSDELLSAMTVPTYMANKRRCSIHAKGWPLDSWLERDVGSEPFVQAVGFNAEEEFRIKRDQSYSFKRWAPGQRTGIYPLLWDWNWGRQACVDFIRDVTGAEWPKSACAYCPFAAGELVLPRFAKYPELAGYSLFIEYCSMALNHRMTLYAGGTLRKLVEDAGDRAALRHFQKLLDRSKWAIYRVQRIYLKSGNAPRRVTIMQEGPRAKIEKAFAAYGTPTTEGGIPRVVTLPREEKVYPTLEELYVAAPRAMGDKQPKNYDFEKNWKHALAAEWDRVKKETPLEVEDLDWEFVMGLQRRLPPDDLGDRDTGDRIEQELWIQEFADVIKTPYDPYAYDVESDEPPEPPPELKQALPSVWHTDIVVKGQGFNVKVEPVDDRYRVLLTPDTPGEEAEAAMDRFARAMGYADDFPDVTLAKATVEQAVVSTKAKWNGWHKEAYL